MIKSSQVKSYGKDEECRLLLKSSDITKISNFRINGMYFDKKLNNYKPVEVMPAHIVSWMPTIQTDAKLFSYNTTDDVCVLDDEQYNKINSSIKLFKIRALTPNPHIEPKLLPKVGAFDPIPSSKPLPLIKQQGTGYGTFYYKYQKYKSKYLMSK